MKKIIKLICSWQLSEFSRPPTLQFQWTMVYTLQFLPWEETTPTSTEAEPSERLLSSVSFSCFLFRLPNRSSSATYHREQLFSKYFLCIPNSTVFGCCLQSSKTPDFLFFITENFWEVLLRYHTEQLSHWVCLVVSHDEVGCGSEEEDCRFPSQRIISKV